MPLYIKVLFLVLAIILLIAVAFMPKPSGITGQVIKLNSSEKNKFKHIKTIFTCKQNTLNQNQWVQNCSNLSILLPGNRSLHPGLQIKWHQCYIYFLNKTRDLFLKTKNISNLNMPFNGSTSEFLYFNSLFSNFINSVHNKCVLLIEANRNLFEDKEYKINEFLNQGSTVYNSYSNFLLGWYQKLKKQGFELNCKNKTLGNDTLCHVRCNNSYCGFGSHCEKNNCVSIVH